jgi:hypothetical protein
LCAINREKDEAIDSIDSELVRKLDEVYASLTNSLNDSLASINSETQQSIAAVDNEKQLAIAAVDNEKQKAIDELIGTENSVESYINEIKDNLLIKIDYIFHIFYRADSTTIMENYPHKYII